MAVNKDDIQAYLGSDDRPFDFRTDSGNVGRTWIDGALVIYDPEDCPEWLVGALLACDEDGSTGAKSLSGVWDMEATA